MENPEKYLSSPVPLDVFERSSSEIAAVIASWQPNALASELLRVAYSSLRLFSSQSISIWIVDLGSPKSRHFIGPDALPEANFILSSARPRTWNVPAGRGGQVRKYLGMNPTVNASFANGYSLAIAFQHLVRLRRRPRLAMTMDMDTMITSSQMIEDLIESVSGNVIAAGVREQPSMGGTHQILHCLGCMWDLNTLFSLETTFLPDFPMFDNGEKAVADAIDRGYEIRSFPNTYSDPRLAEKIENPRLQELRVDRTLDSSGEVGFLHLGRGVSKSSSRGLQSELATWNQIWNELSG